jgi:5-(carboxyamino)imidazole ribonucleotide mutase
MTDTSRPLVAIVMGSDSDLPVVSPAAETLDALGVPHEMHVASAHRTPERAIALARDARQRGLRVIIAAAGGAAHLAGVLAAHTTLPVIGVPIASASGTVGGMDALLATVQMPSGVPVATVAIDGARNAALLAAEIIATSDEALAAKLEAMRKALAAKVAAADARLKEGRQ